MIYSHVYGCLLINGWHLDHGLDGMGLRFIYLDIGKFNQIKMRFFKMKLLEYLL